MRIKDKTMLDRMNAEPAEKVLSDLEAKHGSVQRLVRHPYLLLEPVNMKGYVCTKCGSQEPTHECPGDLARFLAVSERWKSEADEILRQQGTVADNRYKQGLHDGILQCARELEEALVAKPNDKLSDLAGRKSETVKSE